MLQIISNHFKSHHHPEKTSYKSLWFGGFLNWGYPHSWMVKKMGNPTKMDDNNGGYPHDSGNLHFMHGWSKVMVNTFSATIFFPGHVARWRPPWWWVRAGAWDRPPAWTKGEFGARKWGIWDELSFKNGRSMVISIDFTSKNDDSTHELIWQLWI